MYTYFLAAAQDELSSIRNESDVLSHIEKVRPMVGGFFSRERIDFLTTVFLREELVSLPTDEKLDDGSEFFQLDSKLVTKVANAEQDGLLDASAPWDDGAWQGAEVNRMDLAGFLLEFAELCKEAVAGGENIYFVMIEEQLLTGAPQQL